MDLVQSSDGDHARPRRRQAGAIRADLRALAIQLSLLNHQVSARLELKDTDLDCLDLISRHGPLSPSALARLAGLHPATLTGILDRLQKGGWIARERDPVDRRAVNLRALRDRGGELLGHYAGMNAALDQICADYSEDELELISGFLRRITGAGESATSELAGP
jgi:DNA-binding MarR family transcriptional regulator